MNFMPDPRRNLMKVLIAASAIIPIYVIYMSFFDSLSVAIFTSIYSIFIVMLWTLFYFDFFIKKPTFKDANGNLKLKNDESVT
ncbi:MAG: hypothetical protein ACTSO7_03570 [Candidatus Heimdallarchaeota archaeon]